MKRDNENRGSNAPQKPTKSPMPQVKPPKKEINKK